ncbi:hypothetical protein FB107DRAFT_252357 [Schizophyllum commune]
MRPHPRTPSPEVPVVKQSPAPTSSDANCGIPPPSDASRAPSVPGSSSQKKTKGPSADNAMSEMWNTAMAECQDRMGVDFLGPETATLRSEKEVMDYVQQKADLAQKSEDKSRWQKLRCGLIPLARVANIFCAPIGDTISNSFPPSKIIFAAVGLIITASIRAHEEFEQITDALEQIKVHLQVIEMVTGHRAQLLSDTSVDLLVQIIIVLSVIAKMRRDKYGGRFLKAMVEIKPLSDALKELQRISWRQQEAIIAGTLEVAMEIRTSDEMERIMKWLNFDTTCQQSIANNCFTPQEKLNTLVDMLNGRVHGFLVIDALDEAQALNNEHAKIFGALKKLRSCTNMSILVSTRVPLADEDLERDVVSIDRMENNTDIRTALDIEFSNGGRLFGIAKVEMHALVNTRHRATPRCC